jgi:AcrR family transcriptional regulator
VDAEGLDALTVRGLAGRFATGSATLYRHVASRDELLVLIVDHMLGEVVPPDDAVTGRARVEALATELRRVLLRHPHLVPAFPAAPLLGPNALRGSEMALTALLDAGYAVEVAVPGYLALIDYVLGSVFFDSARFDRHGRPDELASDPVETREMIEALSSDDVFAFGLGNFLDGLARSAPPA